MNGDDLLYRLGLERREWRRCLRDATRQRNDHMETCKYLRACLNHRAAEAPAADGLPKEKS